MVGHQTPLAPKALPKRSPLYFVPGVKIRGFDWIEPPSRARRAPFEEIVAELRQVDVLVSQGKPVAEAVRSIAVTEVTYYRWRQEYGGLKGDQVKRLKELEAENLRLRRAVSDLTLEKLILNEAASGNF